MRVKVKKTGKKRWKKGESSTSNPTRMKYRKAMSAISSSTVNPSLNPANLCKIDNVFETSNENDDVFSVVSRCSFSLQNFNLNMNSQLSKDCLAIFAALTEIIRSKGGKETNTEYFAAMMTFLETLDDLELINSCIYICRIIIQGLPESVLKSEFSRTSEVFIKILPKSLETDAILLLKNIIYCLCVLLKIQDGAVWQQKSTQHIFKNLLDFVVDSRPKVRKEAQRAVCLIITRDDLSRKHAAIEMAAEFCCAQLAEFGGPNDSNAILYTIGLLKRILQVFPITRVKSVCEAILQLMTLGNMILKTSCLHVLHNLFLSRAPEDVLSSSLTAKLITALYNYQPPPTDVQLWKSWLVTVQQAHFHLKRLDEKLCLEHVCFFVQSIVPAWTSESTKIHSSVAGCLKSLLYYIIEPLKDKMANSDYESKIVEKLFGFIENALKFQYHSAWNHVIHVLAVFFEVGGHFGFNFMMECVKTLGDLCESKHFSYANEAHYAMGMAIRTIGPEKVLQSIPIDLDEDLACFRHGWIIPILRDNIREAEFSYFTSEFLPLIEVLNKKATAASENGDSLRASLLQKLEYQIWSLLPGFCTNPTGFTNNFKKIAKLLGTVIDSRSDLRIEILSSIRLLVNNPDESVRNEMKKFSKNYLPIFLNIYTCELNDANVGTRLAVLETLKVYLKITDVQICKNLHSKCMTKVTSDETTDPIRHVLMDLLHALLPFIPEQEVKETYLTALKYIKSDDSTVRKKVYRLLEELCLSPSEACLKVVKTSLPQLRQILGETLGGCPPATKAARIRCLSHLLKQLTKKNNDFVVKLIPEVILCVKEPSVKARSSALMLLSEIGNFFLKNSDSSENETIQQYLQLMAAGFASSQVMIIATVAAIGHVLQEFKDKISDLKPIVESCCALLQLPNRHVIDAILALLKIIFKNFNEDDLSPLLETFISGLVSMPSDVQKAFRFKVKEVYVKIVKKFGYLRIEKLVPENFVKIIRKINKDLIRLKKQKSTKDGKLSTKKQSRDDLSETSDDETNEQDNEIAKSKMAKSWLHESSDGGELINFLDPTVSQNITATKPKTKLNKPNREEFAISEDGKLIINDDDDEKDGDDDEEDNDVSFTNVEDEKTKNKKVYKAGGSGIHRVVKTGKIQKKKGDARVKGAKFEPYQYIPLSASNLNKRKRNKVDNLIKSAKKGSDSGRRMRKKRK